MYPYDHQTIESYELEFLAVGEGSRSGDAIVISWQPRNSPRRIVVVDGGYITTGEQIVELIRTRWKTSKVDLVLSSHPDEDHANGLLVVLQELSVAELWMHLPWEHDDGRRGLYGTRFADRSLDSRVAKNLDAARVLAEQAYEDGVKVVKPFTGRQAFDGVIEVVGPDPEYYEALLPDFRCVTESTSRSALLSKAAGVVTRIRESLDIETLTDEGETSAENNSSVVTQLRFNGDRFLLTGDAGIPALKRVADRLDLSGTTPEDLRLIQVPHHGSHHNVGPSVLDRLIGPRQKSDHLLRCAVVSAAPDGAPKHPNRKVTNAFRRRGSHVWATQWKSLRYAHNAPNYGYGPAEPLPFYAEVDE